MRVSNNDVRLYRGICELKYIQIWKKNYIWYWISLRDSVKLVGRGDIQFTDLIEQCFITDLEYFGGLASVPIRFSQNIGNYLLFNSIYSFFLNCFKRKGFVVYGVIRFEVNQWR